MRSRDRRKIGGRNIVGLNPIGSEAGAGRCPTRNSPRLCPALRRLTPDNVTTPNFAAVPVDAFKHAALSIKSDKNYVVNVQEA